MSETLIEKFRNRLASPVPARSTHSDWLAASAVCIVCAIALLSVSLPVASIGFEWPRNDHEGWNAYHAARAAVGEALYSGDPARSVSYPFLSFYLIGWLKPLFGDVLIIGRAINIISLSCLAACGALIVRRWGGRGPEMLFAAAAVLGFMHVAAAAWFAIDEPQMLAEALSFGGLLVYVSGAPTPRRLAVCALLCCAAGFTKPTTAAIPISVTLDLLWRDGRLFLIWCLCGIGALALFTGLSYVIAGGDFIAQVFGKRIYYGLVALYHAKKFARDFKIPMAVCLFYLYQRQPANHAVLLRAAFATALIVAIAASGGEGVSYNVFLEPAALMGIITALAFGRWRERLGSSRTGQMAGALLPLVMAAPVLTKSSESLASVFNLERTWRDYSLREIDFRQGTDYLVQRPGDALCDNLLMCFEAGKPLVMDPFSARMNILSGKLDEATVVGWFEQRRFAVIQLPDVVDRVSAVSAKLRPGHSPPDPLRFTENTLRAIDRSYALAQRIGGMAFYVPK